MGTLKMSSDGVVRGGRIGLCSTSLELENGSRVDAGGLGCPSLQGPGSVLVTNPKCSSPGASHAGRGGNAIDKDTTKRRVR